MVWHDLAFLHWRVDAHLLRPLVPRGLELDTRDGQAWLGVVPFRMSGVRPLHVPLPGGLGAFPELNVRTYVVAEGKPGVWFFSLDARSRTAVRAARAWFHLPYFDARMTCAPDGDGVRYSSERVHRGAPRGRFSAHYRPVGPESRAPQGSLEHFLAERYCLYAEDRRGRILRGEIDHAPWPLQAAEVEIETCDLTDAFGLPPLAGPPLAHFARRLEVRAWTLEAVRNSEEGAPGECRSQT